MQHREHHSLLLKINHSKSKENMLKLFKLLKLKKCLQNHLLKALVNILMQYQQ